jgi:putative endopeptidase
MKELRAKYLEHMGKMLALANLKDSTQTIMAIEMKLAQASMSRVDRRDPKKIYHRLDLAGLEKQAPHLPWKQYFNDLGHSDIKEINVAVPAFFTALDEIDAGQWAV